jgi:hypothetical protein
VSFVGLTEAAQTANRDANAGLILEFHSGGSARPSIVGLSTLRLLRIASMVEKDVTGLFLTDDAPAYCSAWAWGIA